MVKFRNFKTNKMHEIFRLNNELKRIGWCIVPQDLENISTNKPIKWYCWIHRENGYNYPNIHLINQIYDLCIFGNCLPVKIFHDTGIRLTPLTINEYKSILSTK